MKSWSAVFMGGGAGSVLRYAFSYVFQRTELRSAFPWATLCANLLATVFLAWLVLRLHVHLPGKEHWRSLLAVGFCGGFSTLSTFSYENFQLLRKGFTLLALLNILASVGGGILAFYLFARTP
jgi:fluoride exporter